MEFRIVNGLGKRVLAYFVRRFLKRKYGVKVKIKFHDHVDQGLTTKDGVTKFTLAVDAEAKESDISKLLDKLEAEEES